MDDKGNEIKVNDQEKQADNPYQVSNLRRAVPQFLASSAQNLILFDNGLVLSYPTIVIDALLRSKTDPLSLTDTQASWYVSISYICQPIGSTLSGLFMEPLGRKRSMLLLNIPFLTAWMLLYLAPNIECLYLAAVIMGLGVGCTEAPILTYMGEISEARVRGTLTSYAQLFGQMAFCALYYVAGLMHSWQKTAAVCAAIPIATTIAVSMVPESPWWLVSKGRIKQAENALCWLRGWVQPPAVREELDGLIQYHNEHKHKVTTVSYSVAEGSTNKLPTASTEVLLNDKETWRDKLRYYMSPRMRRPFTIICMYFFFYYASGLACMRPYLSPIFKEMGMELKSVDDAALMIAIMGFVGNAVCMVGISYLGKRKLSLTALLGCSVCTLGLALVTMHAVEDPIYGLYFLYALSFFTGLGVAPIPWMLQSELFPFKGRGLAAGCAAAVSYLIGFLGTKTFLSLMDAITLQGVYFSYTVMSIVGVIYLYCMLPETEGKPLEKIEEFFSGKNQSASSLK